MAPKCIGGCAGFFFLGVVFDVIGVTVLLVGVFANLRWHGRFYGDFLIYTGALVVFLSLVWWIMWYSGNLKVSAGSDRAGAETFARWAHRLSRSGVKTLEAGGKCFGIRGVEGDRVAPHAPTRVTWDSSGGTAGCVNGAYEQTYEKTLELDILKNSEMFSQNTADRREERFL